MNVFCKTRVLLFMYFIKNYFYFNITTLNINGLNSDRKQSQLIDFMKYNYIDILLLQEHNIRDIGAIDKELESFCHISLNYAICSKGGTAILINRKLPFIILSEEKSADSRIISLKVKIYDQIIHLINVYAHSGKEKTADRENLFRNEILYYMRNSLQNTFIGGDWNCVLSDRDTTSDNFSISKALLNTVRNLNLKDAWHLKHRHIEYTYVRNNYGSRIDRVYVKDLSTCITNIKVTHVNFSDHSCVQTELNLPDIPKKGKSYWKMNTSLLDKEVIKEKFRTEWVKMGSIKNRYDNLNEWWDLYAKKEIKNFFIIEGKKEMAMKYGLIEYLEFCLNELYNNVNLTGNLQYGEVKMFKDRIDELKNEILEGVKIRSRINEQVEGERVSAYLIKQQAKVKAGKMITSLKSEENIMDNLSSDVILKGKDRIKMYIEKYYEKLYQEENFEMDYQEWFLNFVNKTLTENEINSLGTNVTSTEIFNAIKDMNVNKAPGLDGIPIEFYLKYWDIIKDDIIEIITNIIDGTLLNENQSKAIITLIPKEGGDLSLLKSWRPVSLICCDVKIVAKILAKRLKPLMYSLISENQFCIEGKSIIDCTTRIRDIMYYSGTQNLTGAVINIDWEKAFDRVNWDFLRKVLMKMKFPAFIIQWIATLYTDIQSVVLVNGHFTKSFYVKRGVRQGCPLSMLLFVIFQNPLYIAFEEAANIKPMKINGKDILQTGYADDTNIFTKDNESFLEFFKILGFFEKATNSKLNVRKTTVYGFGNWKGRTIWPVPELKTEVDYFSTLGIMYSENYDKAIEVMWYRVYNKFKNRIPLMANRFFTLYQKAALVNSLLSSKLWYISHVYPLPLKYCNLINKELFRFVWGNYSNPIKRDVLYNKRSDGGIGLLNISQKSKSILVNTVIKQFLLSERDDLIRYYLANRIGNIFNIVNLPRKTAHVNAPFFEFTVDTIKKCRWHKNFPNIKSKDIYEVIVPHCKPSIECLYPNFDWKNIWMNLNFRYMKIQDRNIMFKFMYEILPTNKRRTQIRQRDSPLCETCNVEESNVHKFYYCSLVQECIVLLRKLIFYICGVNAESLLKVLMLDIPKINKRNVNSLCVIISSYIACVWFNRDNLDSITFCYKAKFIKDHKLNMKILGAKAYEIFSDNYCLMDYGIIYRL